MIKSQIPCWSGDQQGHQRNQMKLSGISTISCLLLILFGCNQPASQSESVTISNTTKLLQNEIQEKIIDTIFKLAEVKKRAVQIEEQTKGERNLKIWIVGDSTTGEQKYTWVKVGEDNGVSFVTHFNFHVYPPDMQIMFYETQNDTELSLSEWRKRNRFTP